MAACGASLNSVSDGEAPQASPAPNHRAGFSEAPQASPAPNHRAGFSEAPKPALRRITERV